MGDPEVRQYLFDEHSSCLIVIVETKGQEDLDIPLRLARLKSWCDDVNAVQDSCTYRFVYVDQLSFEKYRPKSFGELLQGFRTFQD